MRIIVWPKFRAAPAGIIVDTTSNTSTKFRYLSPFMLPAPPAQNLENLWQFSKVYYPEHVDKDYNPNHQWHEWQRKGFLDRKAHRYPMGKGRKPLYSMWQGERLKYVEARRRIYIPCYARNIVATPSWKHLVELYNHCVEEGSNLILLDYDGYDHYSENLTLEQAASDPSRKFGHAFVLYGLLTGEIASIL